MMTVQRLGRHVAIHVACLIVAALMLSLALPAFAKSPTVYTGLITGVAVGGYDAVSYFTAEEPQRGFKDFTAEHDGAVWYFSSEENRDTFVAKPEKYAPKYGGYCAYAVSHNSTAKGDPEAWSIVDGRLYLNYNKSVRRTWEKNAKANIKKADANWPDVLSK